MLHYANTTLPIYQPAHYGNKISFSGSSVLSLKDRLEKEKKEQITTYSPDELKQIIQALNTTTINHLNTSRKIAAGTETLVLGLSKTYKGEKAVLKIKKRPFSRKHNPNFDLPILAKGSIQSKKQSKPLAYWYIQPKADTDRIKTLTREQQTQLAKDFFIKQIKPLNNYVPFIDYGAKQLGYYKGKLHLLDFESIIDKNSNLYNLLVKKGYINDSTLNY